MKYRVCITETLEKIVEVDSESEDEAVRKVHESYANCDIILDAGDFMDVEFSIMEE